MIGDAGATYSTAEEAAALVAATKAWTDADWHDQSRRARTVGLRYHADRLMSQVAKKWLQLAAAAVRG